MRHRPPNTVRIAIEDANRRLTNIFQASLLAIVAIGSVAAQAGDREAAADANGAKIRALDGVVTEGGRHRLQFELTAPSADEVRFMTFTVPGTARNGRDFYGLFLKLAFAPGETRIAVPVTILDDNQSEPDEEFLVRVVNANVSVEKSTARHRIVDNDGAGFESMSNVQEKFSRFKNVPSADLRLADLTEPVSRPDNGSVGDGQFRVACEYSHFNMDDPIFKPGQPGAAHLHMFFGNTDTDAATTTDSLVNGGGGTCNGFELNRSAYWTPALLDGKGNAIVPDSIIVYYKTKNPRTTSRMPQGLRIVAGNLADNDFAASHNLHWSCGGSGHNYNLSNRIPDCGGDIINATIAFPQCWNGRDLDAQDHLAHMSGLGANGQCPSTHPVELPQITILLYYPGQTSVDGWYLSSDRHGGRRAEPGATLHADWWGGWNNEAMDLWMRGCVHNARNCSFGQTGTSRMLMRLNPLQRYEGPNVIPLP